METEITPLALEITPLPRPQIFDFPRHISVREKVLNVAKQVAHPFYYYDLDALSTHLQYLKSHTPEGIRLWYATKANPLSHVLKLMSEKGFSFDVASAGEFAQVLRQGIDPLKVLCTGPAKSKNLMRRYLTNGLRLFVIESKNQLQWLSELCSEYQVSVQALLRLQIRFDSSESSVLGGNSITPFGLEIDEWKKIKLSDYPGIQVIGAHSFQWGNILDEDKLVNIWQFVTKKCKELSLALDFPLEVLDLGGGIGIPYRDENKRMHWPHLVQRLLELKQHYQIKSIWLELGRFAVGEYGGHVTQVIDIKEIQGKKVCVLDSGMNQLARPSLTKQGFPVEHLGPFYQQNLEMHSPDTESFQIHGPLCTALDQLGTYDLPKNINIGDWLLFKQCGAYGFTESMPYFLCHSLPGEAVVTGDHLEMIRMPRPAFHYLV